MPNGTNEKITDVDYIQPGNSALIDGKWWEADLDRKGEIDAIFGEINYDITDKASLTVGFRKYEQSVNLIASDGYYGTLAFTGDLPAGEFSSSEKGTIPKIALQVDISDDVMIYGSFTEGYRPSGVNRPRPNADGLQVPETYNPDYAFEFRISLDDILIEDDVRLTPANGMRTPFEPMIHDNDGDGWEGQLVLSATNDDMAHQTCEVWSSTWLGDQATMVSTMDSNPTSPVTITGLTPSMIDNMFIVNPPTEVKQAIEESAKDDQDQDSGMLDVDFLEFNELESDALKDSKEDLEFSELDIDLLDVDFLRDLLDVVEALEKTRVVLADTQAGGGSLSGFRLKGAQVGFNKDSQFNVFEQDGNLVFFRSVNGVINIIIGAGGSGFIDVITNDYEGVMQFNDGDGIEIFIRQVN